MPLVLIMKDKDEELSNLGFKTFAIGTRDEDVFAEGVTLEFVARVREFFAESTKYFCSSDFPNE